MRGRVVCVFVCVKHKAWARIFTLKAQGNSSQTVKDERQQPVTKYCAVHVVRSLNRLAQRY